MGDGKERRVSMFKTITREQLKMKRDRGERFHLVNVLSAEAFARAHIPGSENVPVNEMDERAPALWEPGEEIVVYCAGWECHASPRAAAILDELGFLNVYDFEGWQDGGGAVAFERRAA